MRLLYSSGQLCPNFSLGYLQIYKILALKKTRFKKYFFNDKLKLKCERQKAVAQIRLMQFKWRFFTSFRMTRRARQFSLTMAKGVGVSNCLKKLWQAYLERKRYRKELQKRLLRRRFYQKDREASTNHWTDRFLRGASTPLSLTVASTPLSLTRFFSKNISTKNRLLPLYLSLLLVVLGQQGSGQTVQALKVGEKVPELWLKQLAGKETTSLNGKLLVLDFWSTTCGTCVAKLPEIDSLNQIFKGKVRIIPITTDPISRVDAFLKRKPALATMDLGEFTNDQVFSKVFPYRFLPHEVWINADGIYLGATESEYVNSDNLIRVLNGKSLIDHKKDNLVFDLKRDALHTHYPSVYQGNGWIGHDVDGLRYGGVKVKEEGTERYSVCNASILQLYALAIDSDGLPFNPKRRIISPALLAEVDYDKTQGYQKEWENKHSYWYEITYPVGSPDAVIRKAMLADLNAAFKLKGELLPHRDSVWLLSYQKPLAEERQRGTRSISSLLWELEQRADCPVMIHKIDPKLGVKFSLPVNFSSIPLTALKDNLALQGLLIKTEVQYLPKFKLTKTKP